jgi:phenylacetate-coenzyme A ligase PaaK-like adenylate-forming protein
MESEKINEEKFKIFLNYFGLYKIINYYGTVEQIGSIFFKCEKNFFHCSNFSDIIIRNKNFDPCNFKEKGFIQLLSLLPTSYPGHSILTQDIGTIYGEDNCECGRNGKYFRVFGRVKNFEIRGCSDSK